MQYIYIYIYIYIYYDQNYQEINLKENKDMCPAKEII